jgi:hypothetical protein
MATPANITLFGNNIIVEITGSGVTPIQPSGCNFGTVRQISSGCSIVEVSDLVFFTTDHTDFFSNNSSQFCTLPETDCYFKYTTPP